MRGTDRDRAARAIRDFLDAVGAPASTDPELARTGEHVAEAFITDLLSGYDMDAASILRDASAAPYDGLVLVRDIPATVMCPHHLMPATGVVHVGYLPGGRVAGFGALGKLVECFGRRLVLQETFVQNVAEALVTHLGARGAGSVADMVPTCLTARGRRYKDARAVTSAFSGELAGDPELRQGLANRARAEDAEAGRVGAEALFDVRGVTRKGE